MAIYENNVEVVNVIEYWDGVIDEFHTWRYDSPLTKVQKEFITFAEEFGNVVTLDGLMSGLNQLYFNLHRKYFLITNKY